MLGKKDGGMFQRRETQGRSFCFDPGAHKQGASPKSSWGNGEWVGKQVGRQEGGRHLEEEPVHEQVEVELPGGSDVGLLPKLEANGLQNADALLCEGTLLAGGALLPHPIPQLRILLVILPPPSPCLLTYCATFSFFFFIFLFLPFLLPLLFNFTASLVRFGSF